MASIETVTGADGGVRYRVRYRTGGRSVEQWAKTKTAARAIKRQVEADELTGLLIDPRAGAQRLADYADYSLFYDRIAAYGAYYTGNDGKPVMPQQIVVWGKGEPEE